MPLKSDFDKYASTEEFIGSVRRKLSASALIAGVSFEEYLATQLVQGDHPFEFTGLKPETDYVVYAVGWYAPGDLLTTVLVSAPATTSSRCVGRSDGNVRECRFRRVRCRLYARCRHREILCLCPEDLFVAHASINGRGLEAFKKEVMPTKDEYTGPQTIRKTGLAAGTSLFGLCVGHQ